LDYCIVIPVVSVYFLELSLTTDLFLRIVSKDIVDFKRRSAVQTKDQKVATLFQEDLFYKG
jgi:hypothetical protein